MLPSDEEGDIDMSRRTPNLPRRSRSTSPNGRVSRSVQQIERSIHRSRSQSLNREVEEKISTRQMNVERERSRSLIKSSPKHNRDRGKNQPYNNNKSSREGSYEYFDDDHYNDEVMY